tara:strand:- start:930 stop:1730 length:801 start_codon:yes stop_codon:yes gene_type:complete
MNINNPTTFSSPDLSYSTSNSSGSSGALRADDTIAVFDGTVPATIASASATGSAGKAARRDHVHGGVVAITSTDEAIARYNGTAGLLQNYTSNPPTISDAGVVTLAAGQIIFPATANVSTNANCLDDYEEGSWTPTIQDNSRSNSESQTYTAQNGRYTKIGNRVFIGCHVQINSIGSLTTSEVAVVAGIPYTSADVADMRNAFASGRATSLNLGAAGQNVVFHQNNNDAVISCNVWDATTGTSGLTIGELSDGGLLIFTGSYEVSV